MIGRLVCRQRRPVTAVDSVHGVFRVAAADRACDVPLDGPVQRATRSRRGEQRGVVRAARSVPLSDLIDGSRRVVACDDVALCGRVSCRDRSSTPGAGDRHGRSGRDMSRPHADVAIVSAAVSLEMLRPLRPRQAASRHVHRQGCVR